MTKLLLKYRVPIETEQLAHWQALAGLVRGLQSRGQREAVLPRGRPGRELPEAPWASAEGKGCRGSARPGEQHGRREASLDHRFL